MLSAVVLTKNEEENIEKCLSGLKFCEEIILLDDCSSDKTREIAQKLGAKVIVRNLNNNFSEQRNFGLDKSLGDWILFIDADEILPDKLSSEIKKAIGSSEGSVGYFVRRDDFFLGKKLRYGETANVRLLRLIKKGCGTWKGKVHEELITSGRTKCFKTPLLHYSHPTISDFLQKINYYSSIRASELEEEGKKTRTLTLIYYPLGKFIANYFLRLGFLDGMPGLIMAFLMSFHSFLARSKLYLLTRNK